MKNILFLLLLLFPFFTFASSLEEVQKVEIKLKTKTYNWLVLYTAIDKALDKKTKWDNNKKLALYKKLLSQTEKNNKDIYKKLTIILKYWVNELEDFWNIENSNWVINQINENNNTQWNSIQNAIDSNQNSSISDWTAYYWNEWVIKWQWSFSDKEIEEAWQRAFDSKTEYEKQRGSATFIWWYNQWLFSLQEIKNDLNNQESLINSRYIWNNDYNLVIKDIINDYNHYLWIFKDWWAINNDLSIKQKEMIIRILTSKYRPTSTNDEFIESLWYRYENWELKYYDNLNTLKNELKDFEYLK